MSNHKRAYRILCLGESSTAMGGIHSYPRQLQRILNQRDLGRDFSVINKGIVATNTSVIIAQLQDNLDKYNPDAIIVMMGINDDNKVFGEMFSPGSIAAESSSVKAFFKSCKTYKLVKLLYQHIVSKTGEKEADNLRKKRKEKIAFFMV